MLLARRAVTGLVTSVMGTFASNPNTAYVMSQFELSEGAGLCAEVIPVNILRDNYAYMIRDRESGEAACVDPAVPHRVLAAAKDKGFTLSKALVTHKHWDHSGGNVKIAAEIEGLEVIASAKEDNVPATTLKLDDGESIKLGSLTIKAILTPCHTRGHMMYYVTGAKGNPILFTGDTLFVGGCGRFFEGDGADMYKAMNTIRSLPHETRIFCGHEYTVKNLKFAQNLEPDNKDIAEKLEWAIKVTSEGGRTVPSTIAEELKINPFMRTDLLELQKITQTEGEPILTITAVRKLKDNF